jgi:uncharacterized RDD family membrane protein YckC
MSTDPSFLPGLPVGTKLAGGFSRWLGLIIDQIILNVMVLPLSLPGILMIIKGTEGCDTSGDTISCTESDISVGWLTAGIVCTVLALVVLVYLYSRWLGKGRTPGMKITGNRLVDVNTGGPIGTGRGFGRALVAQFISPFLCALGFLWAIWDPRKQTWHDKIANSVVIKN